MVTWFHQVNQLFLIPIPGVLTQNLGNIVGTWSAHWIMTVSVLFLRLCYSCITLYQQYENNLGYYILSTIRKQSWKVAKAFLKNQMNNVERKILGTVNLLYSFKPAFSKLLDYLKQIHN